MQLNLQLARVWRLVSPGTTFCKRQSIYSWVLRIIEIKIENHHFREDAFKTIEKTFKQFEPSLSKLLRIN